MIRTSSDPLIWFILLLPLIVIAEWFSAMKSGYVGPPLFLAGCLLALPVLLRLALTPAWFSDLLVIVAGIALLALASRLVAAWTNTVLASQPGSAVVIMPALILFASIIAGTLAQLLLFFWPWMEQVHEALEPLGHRMWRGVLAGLLLIIVFIASKVPTNSP